MILVLTNRGDLTADWLILELVARRAKFFRFNTEDYPIEATLAWSPDGAGIIHHPKWQIDLSQVSASWYRRPARPSVPADLGLGEAEWVATESMEAIRGVWKTLDCLWVNHPDLNSQAENKMTQLKHAAAVGLNIPNTVVTNDLEVARDFANGQSQGVVCKPLRGGRPVIKGEERIFFTTKIESPITNLGPAPYMFQVEVEKQCDVRLTVIGQEGFAVRIDSQSVSDGRTDWRRADPLPPHEVMDLPNDVLEACLRLTKSFGLEFAAIDLAVTTAGEYVFFEVNPNGQWVWIEQLTGLPLRSRLADLLSTRL